MHEKLLISQSTHTTMIKSRSVESIPSIQTDYKCSVIKFMEHIHMQSFVMVSNNKGLKGCSPTLPATWLQSGDYSWLLPNYLHFRKSYSHTRVNTKILKCQGSEMGRIFGETKNLASEKHLIFFCHFMIIYHTSDINWVK